MQGPVEAGARHALGGSWFPHLLRDLALFAADPSLVRRPATRISSQTPTIKHDDVKIQYYKRPVLALEQQIILDLLLGQLSEPGSSL